MQKHYLAFTIYDMYLRISSDNYKKLNRFSYYKTIIANYKIFEPNINNIEEQLKTHFMSNLFLDTI
jgi:hypothetical protein